MKYTISTATPDAPRQNAPETAGPSEPTNQKPEYGLADLAAIKCGEVTQRQNSSSPRNAGFHTAERTRELRRMLVRNKL